MTKQIYFYKITKKQKCVGLLVGPQGKKKNPGSFKNTNKIEFSKIQSIIIN